MSGARLAEEHAIALLRGGSRPSRKKVLQALARRAAWLSKKIEAFAGRALDPAASYLVEELASVAIAAEVIEATQDTPPSVPSGDRYLVTIQDKTLYREPDIALAIVAAGDEAEALDAARPAIEQLANAGRGRCVPHARQLETGRFYRLAAVVRIPHDPNAPDVGENS